MLIHAVLLGPLAHPIPVMLLTVRHTSSQRRSHLFLEKEWQRAGPSPELVSVHLDGCSQAVTWQSRWIGGSGDRYGSSLATTGDGESMG
eukprot:4759520-Pyramimonas_sp.AAC.1